MNKIILIALVVNAGLASCSPKISESTANGSSTTTTNTSATSVNDQQVLTSRNAPVQTLSGAAAAKPKQ